MKPFAAWHLPGLQRSDLEMEQRTFGELPAEVPRLTPAQLQTVLAHIVAARERVLRKTPVRDIVAAIDAAAQRLSESTTVAPLLCAATGYSAEVIDDVLAHMIADWRRDSLQTLLQLELGDATVLDEFVTGSQRSTRAVGPALSAHIFSGNVPGVAVTSMVRALLVKSATFGKTASGEPVLPVLFAQALQAVAPAVAECLAVTYWTGGSENLESVLLDHADTLVIYGGEETVASLRARAHPRTRIVEHGPRVSFGVVGCDVDIPIAADIAYATAAYDQQGCVSPHAVFVERGGSREPRDLARDVANELGKLAAAMPRRRLTHAESLAIRQLRAQTEFRGIAGGAAEVFSAEDTGYTVLYDDAPAFPVSCLNRTLNIIAIESFEQLRAVLQPQRARLQSSAVACFNDLRMGAVAELLVDCGVCRISTFKDLPWPSMWWHHDGRGPLRELISWVDRNS